LNLVVNALDAVEHVAPSERQITVATEHRAGSVAMRVTDRGPGVPSELLPRMFEPFVTSKAGGLGLGLYITRSIVTAHGGEIQASANPEGGLVVEVRLPARRESASGAEPLLAGMPAS
jgi:C4-dicarboxylate-specific signal transduction histidine kinase